MPFAFVDTLTENFDEFVEGFFTTVQIVVVSFVIPMVVTASFEGFLAAMAAPFVVGLMIARFLRRTGAVFLGVVSLLSLAFSAPFLADSLLPHVGIGHMKVALHNF